ncbi:hypothetical protein EXIGLDRAFT_843524, partial [Exidia glandulosa HHB12029]
MSTPPVPQEVVDIIIDCAWEMYCESRNGRANPGAHRSVNGAAFNVLALVSRSWVARSRHCAFQDLTFRRKWTPDARQFAVALLKHPLCTLREHVLRLQFGINKSTYTHDIADISYVRNFHNLRTLGLRNLVLVAQLWDSSIFQSVLPPSLRSLEIQGCTLPSSAYLIELIACATGLRSLKCSKIFRVEADECNTFGVHSAPQRLTELSITVAYGACRHVLEWISSAPAPPRIANLELHDISDGKSIAVVFRALHVFGPSIVSLLTDFRIQDQNPLATEADLSTLDNLRHENCKTLQRITFHIQGVGTKEHILTMPWDAIIATLNGSSFRQLERVAFQLPLPWRDEQRDATRDMLKEIVGQQLLANVTIVCRSDGDWS